MEAKEFRIGNIVEYYLNEDGIEWEATTIDHVDISMCFKKNKNFNESHRPIPLTEEWLLRFGFEKIPEYTEIHSMSRDIRKDFVLDNVCFIRLNTWGYIPKGETKYKDDPETIAFFNSENYYDNCIDHHVYAKLEFVHQLQNLFFALRGEELTPNPKD